MPSFNLQPHTKHILLASSVVVVPMVTFTAVLLVLVFDNLGDHLYCPYEEICPESPVVNGTSPSHYYVDFPATRLVFVSSLSSTISFALVGALMSIYAYCAAARLTEASVSANQNKRLPTSYQTSLLVRLLNADYLSLWELSRQPFLSGTKARCYAKTAKPTILRASILVLCLAVLASIFVHAADTYLHIATKAVNILQMFPQAPGQHQYGKNINPWCFDNSETMGTVRNKNFWGCALTVDGEANITKNKVQSLVFTLPPAVQAVIDEPYGKSIVNFTEETGTKFAILGPTTPPPDVDWQATSFALSSQCVPIPATACNLHTPTRDAQDRKHMYVNCSIHRGSPLELDGVMSESPLIYAFFDFHKYIFEKGDTFASFGVGNRSPDPWSVIRDATEQDATQMFPSTWRWVASVRLTSTSPTIPQDVINMAWSLPWGYYMGLSCNTTVYDATYSTVGGVVTRLSTQESNSTVAGIPILASGYPIGLFSHWLYEAWRVMNRPVSLNSWISDYEFAMSTLFASSLAAYTVPADSVLVQERGQKIMARIPVAAVWLLVLANLFFAALGIGLAIMAWRTADQDVHQVRTRLGVPGLAAALFERNSENRIVKSDKELFQENDKDGLPVVLVGVQHTVTGGMAWSLRDNQTGRPCLMDGAKMSTARISEITRSTSEETANAEEAARTSDDSGDGAVERQPSASVPSDSVTQSDTVSPVRDSIHEV